MHNEIRDVKTVAVLSENRGVVSDILVKSLGYLGENVGVSCKNC